MRLLPPKSSATEMVSREAAGSVVTLERWRAAAPALTAGARADGGQSRWTSALAMTLNPKRDTGVRAVLSNRQNNAWLSPTIAMRARLSQRPLHIFDDNLLDTHQFKPTSRRMSPDGGSI